MSMHHIQILLILISLILSLRIAEAAFISARRQCPNKDYCDCNFESRKIECICKQPKMECRGFTFANKSFSEFREIYVNNMAKFEQSFFANAQFSPQFRLSLQSTHELAPRFLENVTGLTLLEIIYFDAVKLHIKAFDALKCETFSFISLGQNTALNLDAFGPDTRINSVLLDFHSTNEMNSIFVNTDPEWLEIVGAAENDAMFSKEQLLEFWSTRARVKKVYIQEVKGMNTLDHRWVPKFDNLDRIEIFYTEINRISPTFALLHSDTLKYLTIRQSKLEILEGRTFELMTRLEYLDLSSNPIKTIEREAFLGLHSLKMLTLQSIQDTYTIGEADLCSLSYLPCGVDVYLDNYRDENSVSCALIFLHELKNDTARFRATVNSRLFKVLPINNIYYQRDVRCRIRDKLGQCLEQTNRNRHCLVSSLGVELRSGFLNVSTDVTPRMQPVTETSQFEKIRLDLANLTRQIEILKARNRVLGELEQGLMKLNYTANEIKLNLSELFELYETEYDSNLRIQHHLNELYVTTPLPSEITTQQAWITTAETESNTITTSTDDVILLTTVDHESANNQTWFALKNLENLLKRGGLDSSSLLLTEPTNENSKPASTNSYYNKWIGSVILVLIIFCILQLVLLLCVLYMFCKQRSYYRLPELQRVSSSEISNNKEMANEILTEEGGGGGGDPSSNKEVFKVEGKVAGNNNSRDRLFMRTQDAKKPRFMPRRPVEFLRESPVSLRNYNL